MGFRKEKRTIEWNDDWRDELEKSNYNCYIRLCECRNTKNDIKIMAKLMYKYNKNNVTAEDCLARMMEWVGSWNSQWKMIDSITNDELKMMLDSIEKI